MSEAARRIAEIGSELEHLNEMLDAWIAQARSACASGDCETSAVAIRWILAVTNRMRTLTREWRELETNAPGGR
jgi:hypothetical protein